MAKKMKPTPQNVTMQQHIVPMPPEGKKVANSMGMPILKGKKNGQTKQGC